MSKIIELIITFVLYFFVGVAAALPLAIFYTRKMDKLISNYFHEIDEIDAARLQSLKEVHAQVDELAKPAGEMHESFDEIHEDMDEIHEDTDEISESFDEIHESMDEMSESFDRIDESLDKMDKSFDKMNESMDRTIEFKRLMRDYSNYKIKRTEARENFCESQFWDEKNIH